MRRDETNPAGTLVVALGPGGDEAVFPYRPMPAWADTTRLARLSMRA